MLVSFQLPFGWISGIVYLDCFSGCSLRPHVSLHSNVHENTVFYSCSVLIYCVCVAN